MDKKNKEGSKRPFIFGLIGMFLMPFSFFVVDGGLGFWVLGLPMIALVGFMCGFFVEYLINKENSKLPVVYGLVAILLYFLLTSFISFLSDSRYTLLEQFNFTIGTLFVMGPLSYGVGFWIGTVVNARKEKRSGSL